MQSFPYKGQLITWKDDRGFGFIKPDDGSKEVFLHISALKGIGRRPIEGDIILYEKIIEANGKIRASKASIQGVIQPIVTEQKLRDFSKSSNKQAQSNRINGNNQTQKHNKQAIQKVLPVVFLIGLGISSISPITNFVRGCNIKGNISVNTGDKLYHLPNMQDYATTNIDVSKGEKWFCTESEAIVSGWKKAPR